MIAVFSSTIRQAKTTFYADGNTKYDEPAYPGVYLAYGTWTLNGNKIHYVMGNVPNTQIDYVFDGTIVNNTMSGEFLTASSIVYGTWTAVKR